MLANAILPPEDDRYTDVRKIDRTTVLEIGDIAAQARAVQTKLDNADTGVNPLGLSKDALLFDLDPALTKTTAGQEGQTHFEQVYDRAIASFSNALALFDYANEMKIAQRDAQNEQWDFESSVLAEDRARIGELIEIFGYPYAADIGVNGTYPDGYDGPDLYNYDLLERTDLTDSEERCSEEQIARTSALPRQRPSWSNTRRIACLGNFIEPIHAYAGDKLDDNDACPGEDDPYSETLNIEYTVGVGLDAGRGRYLPEAWPEGTARKAWGEVQNKLWGVYDARVKYESAITKYSDQIDKIERQRSAIEDKQDVLSHEYTIKVEQKTFNEVTDALILAVKEIQMIASRHKEEENVVCSMAIAEANPQVFGIDNDITSLLRSVEKMQAAVTGVGLNWAEIGARSVENV